jgi:hypothetical protein
VALQHDDACIVPHNASLEKETLMNLQYKPTSVTLRSVFVACALTITIAIATFIDMLASDRGEVAAYMARPLNVIAVHG